MFKILKGGKISNGEIETIKISIYEKSKQLGKIIGFDGTTELLDILDKRPRQYKELEASIDLPHTTLERQLNLLQTFHIIKKKPITSERRETHAYNLTRMGLELMKFIKLYEKEIKLPLEQQKIPEISEN